MTFMRYEYIQWTWHVDSFMNVTRILIFTSHPPPVFKRFFLLPRCFVYVHFILNKICACGWVGQRYPILLSSVTPNVHHSACLIDSGPLYIMDKDTTDWPKQWARRGEKDWPETLLNVFPSFVWPAQPKIELLYLERYFSMNHIPVGFCFQTIFWNHISIKSIFA